MTTSTTIATATHARFADWDRGEPDLTTATCARHAVGSPANEATKATNSAKPLPDDVTVNCTVCGTPNADLIGLLVLDWSGDVDSLYAGPAAREGMSTRSYGLLRGGPPVLRARPTSVAPGTVVVPAKDPRVVVVKVTQDQVPSHIRSTKAGKWRLTLPGEALDYFDTKTKATKAGLARMAIKDWHAART